MKKLLLIIIIFILYACLAPERQYSNANLVFKRFDYEEFVASFANKSAYPCSRSSRHSSLGTRMYVRLSDTASFYIGGFNSNNFQNMFIYENGRDISPHLSVDSVLRVTHQILTQMEKNKIVAFRSVYTNNCNLFFLQTSYLDYSKRDKSICFIKNLDSNFVPNKYCYYQIDTSLKKLINTRNWYFFHGADD